MINDNKDKNYSLKHNDTRFLSYEEAKAIVETQDEKVLLQLEYNETRLEEDLYLDQDQLLLQQNINEETQPNKISPKFYSKSLTLPLQILKLIDEGYSQAKIAKRLNKKKSHISYYVKKFKELRYVEENSRDVFKIIEVTQPGKNFLAMYEKSSYNVPTCRAENIRFKAQVLRIEALPKNWNKVSMNHWIKCNSEINGVKVHLNLGNRPSIEFLPPPIDGYADDDHDTLFERLLQSCIEVAQELEDRLSIKIGRLHKSSKGEWIVYSPVAKAISKHFGQLTVQGIGKINASKPRRLGEFEFYDENDATCLMNMPRRLFNVEQQIQEMKREIHRNRHKGSIQQTEYTDLVQKETNHEH